MSCSDGKIIREEKRRRFAAKQERQTTKPNFDVDHVETTSARWMRQNSPLVTWVSLADVEQILAEKHRDSGTAAAATTAATTNPKGSTLEQWLRPYFDLRDGSAQQQLLLQGEQLFIAEGCETVRLLLQQQSSAKIAAGLLPPIQIKSIFIKHNLLFQDPVRMLPDVEQAWNHPHCTTATTTSPQPRKANADVPSSSVWRRCKAPSAPPPPFQVLVGSGTDALSAVAGFDISRGCLACGVIPSHRDENWLWQHLLLLRQPTNARESTLCRESNNSFHHPHPTVSSERGGNNCSADEIANTCTSVGNGGGGLRILALDGISDTANLGALIRTASAFGVHAVVLSETCCSAWYRRAVRVSMGHVFRVPTVRVSHLARTLQTLAAAPYHVSSYAAVVDVQASVLLHDLKQGTCHGIRLLLSLLVVNNIPLLTFPSRRTLF